MNETEIACRWSDRLAEVLLRGMSREDLSKLRQAADLTSCPSPITAGDAECHGLVERSRANESLQLAIMQRWRQLNAEMVAAVGHLPLDGCSAEQCEAMLGHFGAENVLLELITDEPHDDGTLTQWAIENFPHENSRRTLTAILQRWFDADHDQAEWAHQTGPQRRIVIFGGHHRDENKMNERMFDNSRFDVRWKQCDKSRGTPDDKLLHEALTTADAAIVVISMVSHNVMIIVRRYAKKHGIAFRTVTKATDAQLQAVLDELFPAEQPAAATINEQSDDEITK